MTETSESSLGFPVKGTLRRTPFPKLVRELARTKSTGSLFLLSGSTKKVLFFDGGQPVSVRSNVLAECLGQILAREGLITQSQCDQTLESIRRTGKKQGELLIEMGILSEGNLRYGLEAQFRHKLYDIFAWEDGKYQYKPDTKGEDYGLRFGIPPEVLILIALLEVGSEVRASDALMPHRERFPLVEAEIMLDSQFLEVMPEERHLLSSLDGSRSISELLALAPEPPLPSMTLLLYAAIQAGVAKLATTRRPEKPAPPPIQDERERPQADLAPNYAARLTVTSYEDTPLPGALPRAAGQVPDTDEFDHLSEETGHREASEGTQSRALPSELVAAESDTPEETFDDLDIGESATPSVDQLPPMALVAEAAESGFFQRITEDDEPPLDDEGSTTQSPVATTRVPSRPDVHGKLEEVDEVEEVEEVEELEELEELEDEPDEQPAETSNSDDLDIDDDLMLDGDPLAGDDDLALDAELPPDDPDDPDDEETESLAASDDEMVGLDDLDDIELEGGAGTAGVDGPGANEFSAGEIAIAEGRWEEATTHFEQAYAGGVDVAELHAMLAWSRYKASADAQDMAEHALELLDYAEEMNAALPMVFAYRAAILATLGDRDGAQDAAQRALDLDPYDELAIDVMDSLS